MDHSLFFNNLCIPANNHEEAHLMLSSIFHGVIALGTEDDDRYFLYYDDTDQAPLEDCLLADGYSYADFLDELKDKNEMDLLSFILEIADKSPAIEYLKDEQIEDIASCNFYIPDTGCDEVTDCLAMSWLLEAALLSLPTNEIWASSTVEAARLVDGDHIEDRFILDNISKEEHGNEITERNRAIERETLCDICPNCDFSLPFTEWLNDQELRNYQIIFKKLRLASQLDFQGGLPLFDTLDNADGIREIRFSAYQGGAIRILFKALPYNKQAILLGFIKKSNTEGYKENIERAQNLFTAM